MSGVAVQETPTSIDNAARVSITTNGKCERRERNKEIKKNQYCTLSSLLVVAVPGTLMFTAMVVNITVSYCPLLFYRYHRRESGSECVPF